MEPAKYSKRRSQVFYPDSYKRKVCQEYIETGVTKAYLNDKYHIAGADSIDRWLRKFGLEIPTAKQMGISKAEEIMVMQKKDESSAEDLKRRIKTLERQLEDERIKVEAYSRLIDLAEQKFNIQIKKKCNTK